MKLILCLDDRGGMLFNRRRQSRDRILRAHIATLVAGRALWMNAYSHPLFEADGIPARVDEAFLERAAAGDYAFCETQDPTPYLSRVEELRLYRWNRTYPADLFFTADLTAWRLESTLDFAGSSHERITEEVYIR